MQRTNLFVSVFVAFVIPAIAVGQNQNQIQASPATPATPLNGDNQTLTHACTSGESVALTGSSNKVTLTGSCESVEVTGSNNTVSIELFRSLGATGDGNQFTWPKSAAQSEPRIRLTGEKNTIPN